MATKKTKRIVLGVVGVLTVGFCVWMSPLIRAVMKVGLPGQKTALREYNATSIENLQALRTAMLLYHDNEGQFPHANGWMDALQPLLKTNDLTMEESLKKLRNPSIPDSKPDEFGYAMNRAVSEQFKGDLKDSIILIYESFADRKRNSAGDPTSASGKIGIAVDGNVVTLP